MSAGRFSTMIHGPAPVLTTGETPQRAAKEAKEVPASAKLPGQPIRVTGGREQAFDSRKARPSSNSRNREIRSAG